MTKKVWVSLSIVTLSVFALIGCTTTNLLDRLSGMDFSNTIGTNILFDDQNSPEYIFLQQLLKNYLLTQSNHLEFPDSDPEAIIDRILFVANDFYNNPPDFDFEKYADQDAGKYFIPKELYEQQLFQYFGELPINYKILTDKGLYIEDKSLYSVPLGGYGTVASAYIQNVTLNKDIITILLDYDIHIDSPEPDVLLMFQIKVYDNYFQYLSVKIL